MSGYDSMMEVVRWSGDGEEGEQPYVVNIAERFGLRVRYVREELGLGQGEFARRFRLDMATVQAWEAGTVEPDHAIMLLFQAIELYPREVATAAQHMNIQDW